jgi:hypothetical protein
MSHCTSQYDQLPKQASIPRLYVSAIATENQTISLPMQEKIIDTLTRRSRDRTVGIANGNGLEDREVGVRVPVGSRIFFSPRRPNRLWDPTSLPSSGYRWRSLRDLQLVSRSRKCASNIHCPIRLQGAVLN